MSPFKLVSNIEDRTTSPNTSTVDDEFNLENTNAISRSQNGEEHIGTSNVISQLPTDCNKRIPYLHNSSMQSDLSQLSLESELMSSLKELPISLKKNNVPVGNKTSSSREYVNMNSPYS